MLRGVVGIKSILWILAILRGVYGVMGPHQSHCPKLNVAHQPILPF